MKTIQEEKPWGWMNTLYNPNKDLKVKLLMLAPGEEISHQYHHERIEHMWVVEGAGLFLEHGGKPRSVNLQSGSWRAMDKHEVIYPLQRHKIRNASTTKRLLILEVQYTTHPNARCVEDDIVRLDTRTARHA